MTEPDAFPPPHGDETASTGVLVLTLDGRRVTKPRWIPGEIVNGLPTALPASRPARPSPTGRHYVCELG